VVSASVPRLLRSRTTDVEMENEERGKFKAYVFHPPRSVVTKSSTVLENCRDCLGETERAAFSCARSVNQRHSLLVYSSRVTISRGDFPIATLGDVLLTAAAE